jgi:hypothetical protein
MKTIKRVAKQIGKDAVCTASAAGPLLRSSLLIVSLAVGSVAAVPAIARADEGGVSFWIPGFFGSLAAVPAQAPGWQMTGIYYHDSVSASGNVALAKAIQIGQIPVNVTATANANVNANVNLGLVAATYVFATPVLGGQASATLLGAYGNNSSSLAGTFAGTLTGPGRRHGSLLALQ